MSTIEPPPRPVTAIPRRTATSWTRVVPSIQGRELALWRSIAVAFLALSIAGAALSAASAATLALMLAVPALLVAESQASWWVRTRHRAEPTA
jgi:hypothetical protein